MQSPRGWEQQQRAREFVKRWTGETHERAEKDTFWNELFQIYGIDRRARTVKYEAAARRATTGRTGFIDVFWPGRILVEHKSKGEDLVKAMAQAVDYLGHMEEEQLPTSLVVCDFENFHVRDRITGETKEFKLNNLPVMLDQFGLTEKRDRRRYDTDEDVNLAATELIDQFGKALEANGYPDHERRILLTRIVFCLFADDAGVWEVGLFEDYIRDQTRKDGGDLGAQLERLFQLLATGDRRGYPQHMLEFTYINGGLFADPLKISVTDSAMRQTLLDASMFNWAAISPAIFGSMFQNVMTPKERRNLGAHYTSEQNIMKLIRPLFLDELEIELAKAHTQPSLLRFLDKLSKLTFLDPACGCGNFLVVTYRHLRRLETECLARLKAAVESDGRKTRIMHGQVTMDVSLESGISINQFHGIEIDEWPCRIAEVAMHIQAHLADMELVERLAGGYYAHFPIDVTAKIVNDNALHLDWTEVLPAELCNYVLGNPPFIGRPQRTTEQTNDLLTLWGRGYNGNFDYVTGWWALATRYLGTHSADWAFVSTSSVSQGEPVADLWRPVLDAGWRCHFAHRGFRWRTESKGAAGVHVSIIGFTRRDRPPVLHVYAENGEGESAALNVSHINTNLCDAPDVFLAGQGSRRSSRLPAVESGSQPTDGGFLIVSSDEYPALVADLRVQPYLRRYVGARELLHGIERWCLWLRDVHQDDVAHSETLRTRIDGVRMFRLASAKLATRRDSATPHLFQADRQPSVSYLCIPRHVSVNRTWFPVLRLSADVIAGDANYTAPDPDGFLFGVMSSAMFVAWMKAVGGRIRADLRFSTFTYNNFPLPVLTDPHRARIIAAGVEVQKARTDQALAVQYDTRTMRKELVDAHRHLDRTIDGIFDLKGRTPDVASRQRRLFELAGQDQRR
jgi:hypothetical protein